MSRTPSDYLLCLRVREGDDWAFEELLRRHRDVVFHRCNRYYMPDGDEDDVMQIGRLGLLKAAQQFDPSRGGFRHYASLSVERMLATALVTARRIKREGQNSARSLAEPLGDGLTLGEVLLGTTHDDPEKVTLVREELAERVAVVRRCSPTERRAVAHVLNGRSYSGDKVIDNALQRVRKKLAAAA